MVAPSPAALAGRAVRRDRRRLTIRLAVWVRASVFMAGPFGWGMCAPSSSAVRPRSPRAACPLPEVVSGNVLRLDDTLVGQLGPVVGGPHYLRRRPLEQTEALLLTWDERRAQVLDRRPLPAHRLGGALGAPRRRRQLLGSHPRQISFDEVLGHATPPPTSSWPT